MLIDSRRSRTHGLVVVRMYRDMANGATIFQREATHFVFHTDCVWTAVKLEGEVGVVVLIVRW